MKYNKNEKKLTYEMKSVGDAWMDHVQKHHNTDAVTPTYLAPKGQAKTLDNDLKKESKNPDKSWAAMQGRNNKEIAKSIKKERDNDMDKHR